LTAAAITKDFLADLLVGDGGSNDEVQTAWHNIDMSVLPGPTNIVTINDGVTPRKKSRKV
jgi:hypothetical protein